MKKIDGEIVGNSAVAIRIRVDKRDIRKGAPLNPNACAVALSACRQIKGVTDAYAHFGVIYLRINGKWRRWRTPPELRDEMLVFDRGGRFQDDEYWLIPIPTSELVRKASQRRDSVKRGPSAPRRKRRRPVHKRENVRPTAHGNIGRGGD